MKLIVPRSGFLATERGVSAGRPSAVLIVVHGICRFNQGRAPHMKRFAADGAADRRWWRRDSAEK